MKVNKKALELIDKGLSAKTVGKLTESQINTLHKKLVNEQINVSKTDTATITKLKSEKKPFQVYEKELDEDETDDVTDQNALGATALQDLTGQEAPHDANDMAPDGMDDDSDDNRKMMGMSEEKNKPNPWAICHSQVGPKRTRKFERCVKSVKKQLEEGKNPVSLFIESEITKIVERNLPPRITNPRPGEQIDPKAGEPTTAPTKPITKPNTKPTTRPAHPGKNPRPGEQIDPKAGRISPEDAKQEVIDVILNLLKK